MNLKNRAVVAGANKELGQSVLVMGRHVAGISEGYLHKGFGFMQRKMYEKIVANILVPAGVTLGIAVAIVLRWCFDGASPQQQVTGPVSVPPAVTGPTVSEIVSKHLAWADQQSSAGLDPQLTPIREFFAEARRGTRPFATEALGFDSKLKFVLGSVTGGDEHRKYLEERFAARVFAQADLEKTVEYCVQAFLTHLDNVDSALLINLRADLENVPPSSFSAGVDPSVIEQSLSVAIYDAVKAVKDDMPGMIGREIVSWIAGDVLAQASVKLATSAGILSVGVGSGTVSFGATVVISIAVDYVVSWAWDKAFDPAGELSRKIDGTLTQLEQLIIEGQGDEPGLYRRLLDYGARRSEARNAAIKSVVTP